jgi:hypothetical protein
MRSDVISSGDLFCQEIRLNRGLIDHLFDVNRKTSASIRESNKKKYAMVARIRVIPAGDLEEDKTLWLPGLSALHWRLHIAPGVALRTMKWCTA